MKINLNNIGKRYHLDWIFRNINFEFRTGEPCVIIGPNGSGKSTLLQIVSGLVIPNEGTIVYSMEDNIIPVEQVFRHFSIATPYIDLIEDFTLAEIIEFHFKFKKYIGAGLQIQHNDKQILNNDKQIQHSEIIEQVIEIIDLKKSKNKHLKYYSSGMKQRVKLALAILSDTPLLLLDEPTSNLDKKGMEWYRGLIDKYAMNRLVIVCSNNQSVEFDFCKQKIDIADFKKSE